MVSSAAWCQNQWSPPPPHRPFQWIIIRLHTKVAGQVRASWHRAGLDTDNEVVPSGNQENGP